MLENMPQGITDALNVIPVCSSAPALPRPSSNHNTPKKDIHGFCFSISIHKMLGESALHIDGKLTLAN